MLESTKTLLLMKFLTAGHLSAAEMVTGFHASESSSPASLIFLVVPDEPFEFGRKKTTNAGAALRRQRPCPFQQSPVNRESNVSFHWTLTTGYRMSLSRLRSASVQRAWTSIRDFNVFRLNVLPPP